MLRAFTSLLVLAFLAACAPVPTAAPEPTAGGPYPQPGSGAQPTVPSDAYPAPGGKPATSGALVVFSREGGLQGKSESWSFFADGTVTDQDGSSYTLAANDLTALVEAVRTAGLDKITPPGKPTGTCNDCYQYTLSVNLDGNPVQLAWQDGAQDVPQEVWDLTNKIVELVGRLQTLQ